MKTTALTLTIMMFMGFLTSCDKTKNPSYMKVRMTDAPGDYLEVNVDVQEVRVQYSDADDWEVIPVYSGIYNLLDYQNNNFFVLAPTYELPEGHISQIRLILGPNNTVMLNDSSVHFLKTPSAQQSGLKLNVHQYLPPNDTVDFLLDFDADKSVVENGNGEYILKPVIKVEDVNVQ